MNRTTQHISPNPARDFADAIRAETNNGRDLIDLLHDISQGGYGANHNDRITAANTLLDRGLGKCPKQSPATNPQSNPQPDAEPKAPETPDPGEPVLSPVEACLSQVEGSQGPPPSAHDAPESPRLVTQIGDSLNQSLGPPPSAHTQDAGDAAMPSESPEPLDPFSIQSSIQEYILTITNNGQTLRATLRRHSFRRPRRRERDNVPPPKSGHPPHRPPLGHRPQRTPKRGLPRMPPKVDDPPRLTHSH